MKKMSHEREKEVRNQDMFAAKGTSYLYHDTNIASTADAIFEVNHWLKHTGWPQSQIMVGCYKRADELILQALNKQDLDADRYMLLFTNRLHIFFEEYTCSTILDEGDRRLSVHIMERTRKIITYLYFIKDKNLLKEVKNRVKERFDELEVLTKKS